MDVRVLERFLPITSTTAQRVLIAVAALIEARAVITGLGGPDTLIPRAWEPVAVRGYDILLTGVSKANAAGAVARVLDARSHKAVLSVGIAGVYTGSTLQLGQAVVGSGSVMADDGVRTAAGFQDCSQIGFPIGDFAGSVIPADPVLVGLITPLVDQVGLIATVSTCSGTDDLAAELARRTGAIAECMEGAAVGLVAHRLGIPFAEIRAISNTTGDRSRQVWRVPEALARLRQIASGL